MSATNVKKTRRRAVGGGKPALIPAAIQKLASTFFSENKKMNTAKKKADTARKELYKEMSSEGIKRFDLETTIAGSPTILAVEITPGRSTTVVDVDALRKHCTAEEFMQIVSATVKSVEAIKGKEVLNLCSTTKAGTENVNVKPKG